MENSAINDNLSQLEKQKYELNALQQQQCFNLSPTKASAFVCVTLDDNMNENTELKGVTMTQLPINMNDATTGHKLQGMSKDKLIVVSWTFIPNFIYVVLSRVRALKDLFLLKSLPDNCPDKFQVPRDLQVFERRMRELETQVISEYKRKMGALEQRDDNIE